MAVELKLGVNTCFAAKRWTEPEEWAQIMVETLQLHTCQLSLDLLDTSLSEVVTGQYAEAVRDAVRSHNIELHSTFTGMVAYSGNGMLHPMLEARDAAQGWFERAIDFTAAAGGRGTGGYLGSFSSVDAGSSARREELLAELKRRMGSLASYAGLRGLEFLMFENMSGPLEYGRRLDEAHWLDAVGAASTPRWVLCLDVGHTVVLSDDIPQIRGQKWIGEEWQSSPVLQLQQTSRGADCHWPFTAARNQEGLVDGLSVVEALEEHCSEGTVYMFLEVIHSPEVPESVALRELQESVEYWRSRGAVA